MTNYSENSWRHALARLLAALAGLVESIEDAIRKEYVEK